MRNEEMQALAESFSDYEIGTILDSPDPIGIANVHGRDWEEGKLLEYSVIRALRDVADEVVWPRSIRRDIVIEGRNHSKEVEQLDGAVLMLGRWWMIECKDFDDPVNYEPIAKLREFVGRRPPGTLGLVIARRGFTPAAVDLASRTASLSVLLMPVAEFAELRALRKLGEGFAAKLREASVSGVPDYDSTRDPRITP